MFTLRVRVADIDCVAGNRGARYFGAQLDIQSLFLEMAQRFLRNGLIHHRQELLKSFDHDHFTPQAPPHAAEFETNHTGADDTEARGHRIEFQGVPRIDDILAVVRYRSQANWNRAGCQDDVLGFQGLQRSIGSLYLNLITRQQAAVSLDPDDAVRL